MSNAIAKSWERRVADWADLPRAASPAQRRRFERERARVELTLIGELPPRINPRNPLAGLPVIRPLAVARAQRAAVMLDHLIAGRSSFVSHVAVRCQPATCPKRHPRSRLHDVPRSEVRENLYRATMAATEIMAGGAQ